MPFCFLRRDRRTVDSDGRGGREDIGGIGKGEVVIRIYCMKKLFSTKEKQGGKAKQTKNFPFKKKERKKPSV